MVASRSYQASLGYLLKRNWIHWASNWPVLCRPWETEQGRQATKNIPCLLHVQLVEIVVGSFGPCRLVPGIAQTVKLSRFGRGRECIAFVVAVKLLISISWVWRKLLGPVGKLFVAS